MYTEWARPGGWVETPPSSPVFSASDGGRRALVIR